MGSSGDLDLDPISTAFDDMADSMQDRIARERRFVANVGHELRTPVTVTMGTVELLETRSANLRDDDASLLSLLSQQVARLAQTVLDLLELGTITPETVPDRDLVDVADVARGVLDQRGLPASLVTTVGSTMAVTDPRRLERMIANLVENAQSHAGGVTALAVQHETNGVAVFVDDEGPGIPPEERGNIFELFARGSTSEPGTGSGLGLTIVAEQAELIGAQITVGASPRGGARFAILLPHRDDDEAIDASLQPGRAFKGGGS
jgi:signal transduction histidine kinase